MKQAKHREQSPAAVDAPINLSTQARNERRNPARGAKGEESAAQPLETLLQKITRKGPGTGPQDSDSSGQTARRWAGPSALTRGQAGKNRLGAASCLTPQRPRPPPTCPTGLAPRARLQVKIKMRVKDHRSPRAAAEL